MNWLQKNRMNFDRSLEIVRLYDDIEKQRMENLEEEIETFLKKQEIRKLMKIIITILN